MNQQLPPSSFAAAFRANVVPVLARACEARGLFVALGMETVSEAAAAIMLDAWRAHAAYLPQEHFALLEDWVTDTLLTHVVIKEAAMAAREDALAHVARDIDEWNQRVLVWAADGR